MLSEHQACLFGYLRNEKQNEFNLNASKPLTSTKPYDMLYSSKGADECRSLCHIRGTEKHDTIYEEEKP